MKKILASIILTAALLVATVGIAFAQDTTPTPVSGTVQSIAVQTDSTTNTTTVVVSLLDDQGNPVVVVLDLQTAISLGFVTEDPATGDITVTAGVVGTNVQFTPPTTTDDTNATNDPQHPVGSALADYFGSSLGVDYDTIMSLHDQGLGFGVIAQALWMTDQLNGDADLFQQILNAKLTGDYSGLTLPDGSTPANWGQFRKALLKGTQGNNLGFVMSGKKGLNYDQVKGNSATTNDGTSNGKGNGNGHKNDHGNNGNHGNSNGNNGHGNGNGKP